ncbi:MAG: hypothetical protein IPM91_07275 [Bacteroidetes bacterium]|nr:hypothetical protein [Bacteroidota bacterium]
MSTLDAGNPEQLTNGIIMEPSFRVLLKLTPCFSTRSYNHSVSVDNGNALCGPETLMRSSNRIDLPVPCSSGSGYLYRSTSHPMQV